MLQSHVSRESVHTITTALVQHWEENPNNKFAQRCFSLNSAGHAFTCSQLSRCSVLARKTRTSSSCGRREGVRGGSQKPVLQKQNCHGGSRSLRLANTKTVSFMRDDVSLGQEKFWGCSECAFPTQKSVNRDYWLVCWEEWNVFGKNSPALPNVSSYSVYGAQHKTNNFAQKLRWPKCWVSFVQWDGQKGLAKVLELHFWTKYRKL